MRDIVNFRVDMTKEDLEIEQEASKKYQELNIKNIKPITELPDTPLADAHFVEPVSMIIGTSILYLAKRLIDHWLKEKEQGVMMDMRETPPLISRIAGIPMGFLVIIDKSGQATTHKADYSKDNDESLKDIVSLLDLALKQ